MRVAVCLFGNLGNVKRSGERIGWAKKQDKEVFCIDENTNSRYYDPKLGFNNLKKKVFDQCENTDVFIHSWSKFKEKEILDLYAPKKYIIEDQRSFDTDLSKYHVDLAKNINEWEISPNAKFGYSTWLNDRKKKKRCTVH